MDISKIRQILPHRYPMLLVDRITEIIPKLSIKGYKNITINEEVFLGHFPDQPIYPGVMVVEGMAQAGGLLAFISTWGDDVSVAENKIVYFMTIDKVKFRVPIIPGDKLEYELNVLKNKGSVWHFEGKATVAGKIVAEGELKAMVTEKTKG